MRIMKIDGYCFDIEKKESDDYFERGFERVK